MMKARAIIYNNESQCKALLKRVHKRLSKNKAYKGKRYAVMILHPSNGTVAAIIEDRPYLPWYNDLMDELTPAEKNSISELTPDWYVVND